MWAAAPVLAVVLTMLFANGPVSGVAGSCSKGGALHEAGTVTGATCADTVFEAFGYGPLIRLGLLLVVPTLAAGLIMRSWVSWCATIFLLGLMIVGLLGANGIWIGLLTVGGPVAVIAVIATSVHQGIVARRDSQRRERPTGRIGDLIGGDGQS